MAFVVQVLLNRCIKAWVDVIFRGSTSPTYLSRVIHYTTAVS